MPLPKLAPASRSASIRCAGLSGPPRPSPGARPDELVAVGRDAECLALVHAVQWHCERRVLLNGNAVVFR
jgi:hypothetical protein